MLRIETVGAANRREFGFVFFQHTVCVETGTDVVMQMGDRSNPRSSLRIVPVGMDQSPQACDLREIDPCGQSGEGSFPVEQLVEIGGRERFGSVHCGYVLRFSDERSVSMGVLWNGQFDFMVSMIRMSLRIVPCGRTNPSFQAFISCRIDCGSPPLLPMDRMTGERGPNPVRGNILKVLKRVRGRRKVRAVMERPCRRVFPAQEHVKRILRNV